MRFENIIGNTEVKKYLEDTLRENNILHSYLFLGTEGIGKKIIAEEFAKKILCKEDGSFACECKSCLCFNGKNHPDYVILDEEENSIKIDQIREITDKVIEKPILSNKKVYIINNAEKMTKEAQNCLLKTLEEPPEFVVIILISSNENFILNTIKSRCMSIKFKNISDNELKKYAIEELKYENLTENLLKSFGGSVGKAIKLNTNKEKYFEIEKMINTFETQDIIECMLNSKIIYDKENIYDILDYIIVCLYSNSKRNNKYIYCIEYVNKCLNRIRSNCNFDMSIDAMIFTMWEELNENHNRS